MITKNHNNLARPRAYRIGLWAAAGTVVGAVTAALVLPMDIAWPIALVAPFVGMTILEALLGERPRPLHPA